MEPVIQLKNADCDLAKVEGPAIRQIKPFEPWVRRTVPRGEETTSAISCCRFEDKICDRVLLGEWETSYTGMQADPYKGLPRDSSDFGYVVMCCWKIGPYPMIYQVPTTDEEKALKVFSAVVNYVGTWSDDTRKGEVSEEPEDVVFLDSADRFPELFEVVLGQEEVVRISRIQ